jgi:hypothetical protein
MSKLRSLYSVKLRAILEMMSRAMGGKACLYKSQDVGIVGTIRGVEVT